MWIVDCGLGIEEDEEKREKNCGLLIADFGLKKRRERSGNVGSWLTLNVGCGLLSVGSRL